MRTFKTKFIFYIVFLAFFISFLYLGFYLLRSNKMLKETLIDKGSILAKDLAHASVLGVLSQDRTLFESPFSATFKDEDVLYVLIYHPNGRVFAFDKKIEIEEKISRDILEQIKKQKTPLYKESYTREKKLVYDFYHPVLADPLGKGEEMIGLTRIGLSLERMSSETSLIFRNGFLMTLFIIALSIGIAVFLAKGITEPIGKLMSGVEAISGGDLEYHIEVKTKDEIGKLASAFNQMAGALNTRTKKLKNLTEHLEEEVQERTKELEEERASLEVKVKARTKELRELTAGLEEKVQERTKELQERVEELEKFHRLTVGRELRMIELKKEIGRLKEELKNHKTNQ